MKVGEFLGKAEHLAAIDYIPRDPGMNLDDPAISGGLNRESIYGRMFFLQSSAIVAQHVRRSILKELKDVFKENGIVDHNAEVELLHVPKLEAALSTAINNIMRKVHEDTNHISKSKSIIQGHMEKLKRKHKIVFKANEFRFDGYTESALHHNLETVRKRFMRFFKYIRWSDILETGPSASAELSAE